MCARTYVKKLEISNKKEWRLAALCLMVNIVSLLLFYYIYTYTHTNTHKHTSIYE